MKSLKVILQIRRKDCSFLTSAGDFNIYFMLSTFETANSNKRKVSIPEILIPPSEKIEAVESIANSLIDRVVELYGEEGTDKLPFHGPDHSVYVGNTALKLYETIVRSAGDIPQTTIESDACAIAIAGAGHDLNIDTKPIDTKEVGGTIVRTGNRIRLRGWVDDADVVNQGDHRGNEYISCEKTLAEVRTYDYEGNILGSDFPDKVRSAIKVTLPEIDPTFVVPEQYRVAKANDGNEIDLTPYLDQGTKAFKISQKFNTASTPLHAMCLGLADLSYPGHLLPEQAVSCADAEYRELNVGIIDRLEKLGLSNISLQEKKDMITSMLGWMKSQIQFGITQKYNFDTVLEKNIEIHNHAKADDIRNALRAEHPHFDDFIAHQVSRYESFMTKRKNTEDTNIDFLIRDLARAMGIEIRE